MNLKLVETFTKYARKDKILYLFSNIPFWFVASKEFDIFFNELLKDVDKEKFFVSLDHSAKELINNLIEIGIISEDGTIKNNLERLKPKARIWDMYDICELELTLGCNLRCKHCYISAGVSKKEEITLNDIKNILKDLKEFHKNDLRGKRIVLTGGEPFLRKDLLKIIEEITKQGFQILINSNGLLISKFQIEELKKYNNLQICISLDGLKKNHELIRGKETFEKTINKIKKLSTAGIKTSINMLCHQGNFKELEKIFELTKNLNLYGINPVPVVLMGRVKDSGIYPIPEKDFYIGLYNLFKKNENYLSLMKRTSFINFIAGLSLNVKSHYCGTGSRGTFFVSCDGLVYPCPNMRFSEFNLGNIHNKRFLEIIQNNPILKKLQDLSVDNINDKCKNCDVRYFCGGFCRGETYYNTKNICSPYVRCEEYKQGILESLWLLSEDSDFFEKKSKEFYENSKELNH